MNTARMFFAFIVLSIPFFPEKAAAQSFQPFTGYWRGEADGEISSGKTERLTCISNNSMQGTSLRVVLRCVNASGASVRIYATISQNAGTLSGTWEERTYNVSGTVRGRANANTLNASIESPNFVAAVTVTRFGDGLTISLIPTQGTGKFTVAMQR